MSGQPRRTLNSIQMVAGFCDYPGFVFKVGANSDGAPWLQIQCPEGVDTATGAPSAWSSRKWPLSYYMTDTEIVQTAWAAVQRALIHEASEMFKFMDAAIFDRHISIYRLVEVVLGPDAHDSRINAMDGLGDGHVA